MHFIVALVTFCVTLTSNLSTLPVFSVGAGLPEGFWMAASSKSALNVHFERVSFHDLVPLTKVDCYSLLINLSYIILGVCVERRGGGGGWRGRWDILCCSD